MHATSTAKTDIRMYANQYTLMLYFTDDRKKVAKLLEYVGSAHSMRLFEALVEAGLRG